MIDNNHKKRIVILKYVNYIFFFLQLYSPFTFIYYFFLDHSDSCLRNYENIIFNTFTLLFVIVAQILFLMETICLQHLFSEGYRKKMRRICFVGTIFFLLLGYIFYVATIFWRWEHDRTGRRIKIYQ